MATLADSFLQDLEELEDDEENLNDKNVFCCQNLVVNELDESSYIYADIPDAIELYNRSLLENVSVVSNLSHESDFVETMKLVRELSSKEPDIVVDNYSNSVLAPAEYDLMDKCNNTIATLDMEILNIYSFVRDIYSKKFPELESIVSLPLVYIAVVQRIKNETDLTLTDLTDILPNTVTMAVTVAASMTTGQPLPLNEMVKTMKACEEAMHLADCRSYILYFLETRMGVLAPNISAIIGSALAARLITHARGLLALARMPAQNIMLIGSSRTTIKSSGSSLSANTNVSSTSAVKGIIYGCDIIQNTPLSLRNRALKLVSGKIGLAARVDSFRESPHGEVGCSLRESILKSLIKAKEPPPAPIKKALPIPDDAPKARRGGKRYRRSKEKYGLSELRKQANRLAFGPEPEDEANQEGEEGFGMINKGLGHGRLRLQAKQQKVQVKRHKRQQRLIANVKSKSASLSSGATDGISSSLAFTPLQGIELCNPELLSKRALDKNDKDYFSNSVNFNRVDKRNTVSTH